MFGAQSILAERTFARILDIHHSLAPNRRTYLIYVGLLCPRCKDGAGIYVVVHPPLCDAHKCHILVLPFREWVGNSPTVVDALRGNYCQVWSSFNVHVAMNVVQNKIAHCKWIKKPMRVGEVANLVAKICHHTKLTKFFLKQRAISSLQKKTSKWTGKGGKWDIVPRERGSKPGEGDPTALPAIMRAVGQG